MPPKTTKVSKKDVARLEAERSELLRVEMEKQRKKKIKEEIRCKQIERELARKQRKEEKERYAIRVKQLKCTMSFFVNVKNIIDNIKLEEQKLEDWKKYMHCNVRLPVTNRPSDLRQYIHQWRNDIKQHENKSRNWLLQTDERSVLTHSLKLENRTRAVLKQKQIDEGILYKERLEDVLWILQELNEAVTDNRIPIQNRIDLKSIKAEIRSLLREQLDSFSHRIMCNIERDMEIEEPGISKYTFTSDIFKIQLWAFSKHAQISTMSKLQSTEQNQQHNEIDFPLIHLRVSLPPSVNLASSAFRGIWLSYDHYSDFCASFDLKEPRDKCLNILQQVKKEWNERKAIYRSILDGSLRDKTTILAGECFDIDKIFNDYEENRNKARLQTIGPGAFNLLESDVNLRKYRIIGGIFSIDYLQIPQQYKRINPKTFIRTIRTPDCMKHKDYYQSYKPPPPVLPGVRRLPEEIEAELRMVEAALDKLALVTIDLPDSVIWFEPPIVCRWEISSQESISDPQTRNQTDSATEIPDNAGSSGLTNKNKTISRNPLNVGALNDFDVFNIPSGIDIKSIMDNFINPRLPDGLDICLEPDYKSFRTTLNSKAKTKKKLPKVLFIARHKKAKKVEKAVFDTKKKKIAVDFIDQHEPLELFSSIIKPQENEGPLEEQSQQQTTPPTEDHQPSRYMFSQLLKDIDELCARKLETVDHYSPTILVNTSPNQRPAPASASILQESDELGVDNNLIGGATSINGELSVETISEKMESKRKESESESNSDSGETSDADENRRALTALEGATDINSKRLGQRIINKISNTPSATADVLEQGKWSTRDVHDIKFNEDKYTIQFRTGRFGIFGIAANRYSNMPYQTWELKPDMKSPGNILFSFTASIVSFDMTITSSGFCVNGFQGGSTKSINEIIGQHLSLAKLKSVFVNSAVDVFPDEDAFCYTEGSCEKHFSMETHLYDCMSAFGLSHNFGWSRWNILAGGRSAVLLMRELSNDEKMPNYSTLLVTPLKTTIIDSSEVSASFNPVDIPGMDYYADLYQLAVARSQPDSLGKQRHMNPLLRENVASILKAIRPISFC